MAQAGRLNSSERVTVGVLVSAPNVYSELQACLRQSPVRIAFDERVSRPDAAILARLKSVHPELLLVEQPADCAMIEGLMRTLAAACPDSTVVLVNDKADPQAIVESIRAGARDYLYIPFGEALAKVIGRVQATPSRSQRAGRAAGRVIGFLSAKGGCGATTIALHAAVSLARETGKTASLADFDLTGGSLRFLTNARNQYTVLDAALNADRLDDSFWEALVSECSGVEVLAAPAPLAAKEYPETSQFVRVLQFMRSRYAWTVVDLGRGIHPFPAAMLDQLDELYVVTTPDPVALAQTKRVADSVRRGCGFESVRLIVNRSPAAAGPEIERMTGVAVSVALVDAERDVRDALGDNRLISEKSQICRQLSVFARRMAGLPQAGPDPVAGLMGAGRGFLAKVLRVAQGRRGGDSLAAPETAWEALGRDAEAAFKSGQYELAARCLTQAVEEARSFGAGDPRVGRSLNRLGVVQCHQGKYAEAERSLKIAAKVLQEALGEADPAVLEVQSNLAGAYKATREYEAARQLYENVLKTAEASLGAKHTMVAWVLDGLGDVHLAQAEPTAALYAYRRALAIKEQTLGPNDWDVAVTLDKISEFYYGLGRYNEAEPLLWRSIEIRTAVLGPGGSALAGHFTKLGTLYAAQRKFTEAERLLRYGIALAQASENAGDLTPFLHKLAEVYDGLARFGEAETTRALVRRLGAAPDSAEALAREFGSSLSLVPRAPTSLRARWAQTGLQ